MGNCMPAIRTDYWQRIGSSADETDDEVSENQTTTASPPKPPTDYSVDVFFRRPNTTSLPLFWRRRRRRQTPNRFILVHKGWLFVYDDASQAVKMTPRHIIKTQDPKGPQFYFLGYCKIFGSESRRTLNVQQIEECKTILLTTTNGERYSELMRSIALHRLYGTTTMRQMRSLKQEKISRRIAKKCASLTTTAAAASDSSLVSCLNNEQRLKSASGGGVARTVTFHADAALTAVTAQPAVQRLSLAERYTLLVEAHTQYKQLTTIFETLEKVMVNRPNRTPSETIFRLNRYSDQMQAANDQLSAIVEKLRVISDDMAAHATTPLASTKEESETGGRLPPPATVLPSPANVRVQAPTSLGEETTQRDDESSAKKTEAPTAASSHMSWSLPPPQQQPVSGQAKRPPVNPQSPSKNKTSEESYSTDEYTLGGGPPSVAVSEPYQQPDPPQ